MVKVEDAKAVEIPTTHMELVGEACVGKNRSIYFEKVPHGRVRIHWQCQRITVDRAGAQELSFALLRLADLSERDELSAESATVVGKLHGWRCCTETGDHFNLGVAGEGGETKKSTVTVAQARKMAAKLVEREAKLK